MAPRTLIADAMSPRAAEVLSAAGVEVDVRTGLNEDALCDAIGVYDALLVRSSTQVTARVLQAGGRLKIVGRAGIGLDNIDLNAARDRGVEVVNAPTGNATTTAEHALALLFALARHVPQATASMRGGLWEKKRFMGQQIAASTVGVIGLGNIGRLVARRLLALEAVVIAVDPVVSADEARAMGVELVELPEMLARANAITLHVPLVNATHHLLNDAAFAQVKPGLLLVNCARGGIVDEAALARALDSGQVARAALDVFEQEPPPADHPLLNHPSMVLTPHLGASTAQAQVLVAVEIAQVLVAALQGEA